MTTKKNINKKKNIGKFSIEWLEPFSKLSDKPTLIKKTSADKAWFYKDKEGLDIYLQASEGNVYKAEIPINALRSYIKQRDSAVDKFNNKKSKTNNVWRGCCPYCGMLYYSGNNDGFYCQHLQEYYLSGKKMIPTGVYTNGDKVTTVSHIEMSQELANTLEIVKDGKRFKLKVGTK
jgi:hypothetical protein